MEGVVVGVEVGAVGAGEQAHGFVDGGVGQVRVQADEGVAQAAVEHDVAVGGAFGRGLARGDVGAVDDVVADVGQPFQGGLFDGVFDEGGHRFIFVWFGNVISGVQVLDARREALVKRLHAFPTATHAGEASRLCRSGRQSRR